MTDAWRVSDLLSAILPTNRFYARKLAGRSVHTPLNELPFTTKAELVADQEQAPPYGSNLTFPRERYTRLHQTSGTTTGRPLRWLDTPQNWSWLLDCWDRLFQLAGIGSMDRLFFPFSFGPFLGFWTAFEAAVRAGWFCLPGGGLSSSARVRFLLDHAATVVLCTPTYALHLAEVAHREQLPLRDGPVRVLLVAGEPGGSVVATRQRIERAWGARVIDHYGMTEMGPVSIETDHATGGLHALTDDYLVEVIDSQTGQAVEPGTIGELVLTNRGRIGSPLIRYRTGDRVRLNASRTVFEGGVLGRTDDMIHVRGNNLYPSALEAAILRFAEVAEFRVIVDESAPLAELRVEVELTPGTDAEALIDRLTQAIRDDWLFRAEVVAVPPGSLPRFEMKARRVQIKSF